LDKADVELVRRGFWAGVWNPTVKVQVKTTIELREENGHFVYDLDVATYNVLRPLMKRCGGSWWYSATGSAS
jgi:hypothetical protein